MNIVFDIGGTNMRVAAANGMELGDIKKVPTPQDPKEGIATLVLLAKELAGKEKIDAVAGDIAGQVDSQGKIFGARNLKPWVGTNMVQELHDAFNASITIVNDCEAAGLGEAHAGAGKGAEILVYITVSTGVGGARIDHGAIDFAADNNFIIPRVQINGADIENLISGTAVEKKFGIHPKDLESIEERNKLADILSRGLVKITEEWKPDTIVLGGSMIVGINPIPLDRTEVTFKQLLKELGIDAPEITMAQLGDNGGLIGAAFLASQR